MTRGRPTKYSNELATEICKLISDGKSVKSITKDVCMPSAQTIYTWLNDKQDFLDMYTRAKEEQAEALVEEMMYIAETEEDVNRARLKIDTIKWCAAKLKPAKYGDLRKTTIDVNITNHEKWVQEELIALENHKERLVGSSYIDQEEE